MGITKYVINFLHLEFICFSINPHLNHASSGASYLIDESIVLPRNLSFGHLYGAIDSYEPCLPLIILPISFLDQVDINTSPQRVSFGPYVHSYERNHHQIISIKSPPLLHRYIIDYVSKRDLGSPEGLERLDEMGRSSKRLPSRMISGNMSIPTR